MINGGCCGIEQAHSSRQMPPCASCGRSDEPKIERHIVWREGWER